MEKSCCLFGHASHDVEMFAQIKLSYETPLEPCRAHGRG